MDRSVVALVRCETYEQAAVEAAVERGLALLGGMASIIRPGEAIVLKPNVLVGDAPEKLVCPHPSVFRAVARLAQAVTPHLTYGDSPGMGRPVEPQMRRAGLSQAAQALGIPLADFEQGREVEFPASPFIKGFTLANGVLDADGLISIAKFKTHGFMRLTGAVKNQFGCVPGTHKPQFHLRLAGAADFGKMLVCLNLYLRPRLYIVDGIMAMEGNGPRNGDPVPMKVLLFSRDPVALDAVMCRLIDLDPEEVPTSQPGREWGLGTYRADEIELVGDPIEPLVNRAFRVVRGPGRPPVNPRAAPVVRNLLAPRPVIRQALCTRCGTCVQACPVTPKAVDWRDGRRAQPPAHRYEHCIRCYCCQELCPARAITIRTPLPGRIMERLVPALLALRDLAPGGVRR